MTMEQAHTVAPHVDFPSDVENSLVLLRACLADLRIAIDRANDDDLRAMLGEHLKETGFRVATDDQLQFAHGQAAEAEYCFRKAQQAMLDRLAGAVCQRPEPDDLPW